MASVETAASTSGVPQGERQLAVRLSTKDAAYSVPSTKFVVPASWRRFHLSELINKVLDNATPIPFDFLLDSTLLRSSLGAYCEQNGISEETVLDIEYLPSTLPPQLQSQLPTEDWISDVSLQVAGTTLTASYGGTLSLHNTPSTVIFSGHDLSVLSCCHVGSPNFAAGRSWIASGGMDRVGRVWEYESSSTLTDAPVTPSTIYTLSLHTAPISSIRSRSRIGADADSQAPHLISAGWDGMIGIWDLTKGVLEGDAELEGEERRKKRKKTSTGITNKSPITVLRGHTGKISRAIFDRSDATKAYSAGYDHTVREWDLSLETETASKTSDKVLMSLSQQATPNLLATGTTDRLVALWDLRDTTSNISLLLPGHTGPVSSVCSHPTSSLLLASGSYDSTVRVWDARSPKQALFVMPLPPKEGQNEKAEEKILAVDWDGERLVAGGEGNRIVSWRVSGSEAPSVTNGESK